MIKDCTFSQTWLNIKSCFPTGGLRNSLDKMLKNEKDQILRRPYVYWDTTHNANPFKAFSGNIATYYPINAKKGTILKFHLFIRSIMFLFYCFHGPFLCFPPLKFHVMTSKTLTDSTILKSNEIYGKILSLDLAFLDCSM